MFKVGDKVVYYKENISYNLKIGDIFIVKNIYSSGDLQVIQLVECINTFWYLSKYFKDVLMERTNKINKIKERICSK